MAALRTCIVVSFFALAFVLSSPATHLTTLGGEAYAQPTKKGPPKTNPTKPHWYEHDEEWKRQEIPSNSGLLKTKLPTTCSCTVTTTTYDENFDPHDEITKDVSKVKDSESCGNRAKSIVKSGDPQATICAVCIATPGNDKYTECRLPM